MIDADTSRKVVADYLDNCDGDAFDRCVALGASVIPSIVEVLRQERAVPPLTAVLCSLAIDDPVTAFSPLATSDDVAVARAGIAALGASRDHRALPILRDALTPWPSAAISALGELGSPLGIPLLQREASQVLRPEDDLPDLAWVAARDLADLEQFARTAIALAKLGDHSLKDLAIHMTTLIDPGDPAVAAEHRLAWVRALAYLTGPGVAPALQAAIRDPDLDVAKEAMIGALYLGRAQDTLGWIAAIADEHETAPRALWCLEAWAGAHPTGQPGEMISKRDLLDWWTSFSRSLAPDICYRLGQPISLTDLVPILPNDPEPLRKELRAHTGTPTITDLRWGDEVSVGELARVRSWFLSNAARFPPGKLVRWGTVFDPLVVD